MMTKIFICSKFVVRWLRLRSAAVLRLPSTCSGQVAQPKGYRKKDERYESPR
jgi:hypothetical protein